MFAEMVVLVFLPPPLLHVEVGDVMVSVSSRVERGIKKK